MSLWDKLSGIRAVAKQIRFIYEPYKKIKISYVNKKKIKGLHNNGVEIINSVENALTDYNLVFFADYGTLLGIIREHDFIKWDNDLDYGIIVDENFDWKNFEKHMNKYGFNKIREFSLIEKTKEQTYRKGKSVLTVDFFAKIYENNDFVTYGFFKKKNYKYNSEQDYHVKRAKCTKVKNTKRVPFLGTYVTIPNNSEEYLTSIYTKNWRTPDPKWDDNANERKVEEIPNIMGKGIVIN